jgi:hypothetical protein
METSILISSLVILLITVVIIIILRPLFLWYYRINELLSYQLKNTIILEQLLQTMNKEYKGEIIIKNNDDKSKQKITINQFVNTLVKSPKYTSQYSICRFDEEIETKTAPEKESK